jgi:antitoxin HicB
MAEKLPRFEIRPLNDDDGGGYLIEFPEYPGCMADRETPEEAIAEGRDALASYIATLRELGRPVPPAPREARRSWPDQISASVRTALTRRADAEGISLSALVAKLLAEGLERRMDR